MGKLFDFCKAVQENEHYPQVTALVYKYGNNPFVSVQGFYKNYKESSIIFLIVSV